MVFPFAEERQPLQAICWLTLPVEHKDGKERLIFIKKAKVVNLDKNQAATGRDVSYCICNPENA
jgi:hypothetical protein